LERNFKGPVIKVEIVWQIGNSHLGDAGKYIYLQIYLKQVLMALLFFWKDMRRVDEMWTSLEYKVM